MKGNGADKSQGSVISLFSGAMGLDLGLEMAGLEIRVAQELDKNAVATALLNRGSIFPIIKGDIRDIPSSSLLGRAKLKPGEAFAVVGGPPCQDFSTAGKRLSIEASRGSLFREFIRIIDETQPRFFIMENVKGLLSAAVKHLPIHARGGQTTDPEEKLGSAFEVIKEEFSRIGYSFIYNVLDAVNYGVPQFRERLVIVGSRDHEELCLPSPTHFQHHQNEAYRWATLNDAIKQFEETPGPSARFSKERARFLEHVPPGGHWRNLPKNLIRKALGGAYDSGGGKMGFYRRLSYAEPSPTLVTSPIHKGTMLCHPGHTRPLSVNEYAAIQQFPPEWNFCGGLVAQYKQIGNAVPLGLGYALGQTLQAVATGTYTVKTKRNRTQHGGGSVAVRNGTIEGNRGESARELLRSKNHQVTRLTA